MKTEESGKRTKVRGTINAAQDSRAVKWLTERLADMYGGCTVIPGVTGIWVDPVTGKIEEEAATIIEVSFYPMVDVVDYVRADFQAAQYLAGGEWCHIEVTEFEAGHVHVKHEF